MNNPWLSPLAWTQGSGNAVTAANTPTSLLTGAASSGKALINGNGNFWQVGTKIAIEAYGKISCAVGTPGTARFDVRIGSVVVFDGLAVPLNIVAKTDVAWRLEILLECLSIGNGTLATLRGQGAWTSQASIGSPGDAVQAPGSFLLPYNTAPGSAGTGFDSTVAALIDIFFTQTVGTGSCTLLQYTARG